MMGNPIQPRYADGLVRLIKIFIVPFCDVVRLFQILCAMVNNKRFSRASTKFSRAARRQTSQIVTILLFRATHLASATFLPLFRFFMNFLLFRQGITLVLTSLTEPEKVHPAQLSGLYTEHSLVDMCYTLGIAWPRVSTSPALVEIPAKLSLIASSTVLEASMIGINLPS